ncbi:unnamed protein product, partial [Musa acuminata subsp. burmannicoides]
MGFDGTTVERAIRGAIHSPFSSSIQGLESYTSQKKNRLTSKIYSFR